MDEAGRPWVAFFGPKWLGLPLWWWWAYGVLLVINWLSEINPAVGSVASILVILTVVVGWWKVIPAFVRWRKKRRTFLSPNVTTEFLCGLRLGVTEVAADRALRPYEGKWMRYAGGVGDVSDESGSMKVTVYERNAANPFNNRVVLLHFNGRASRQRLEVMPRGTPINVVGRLQGVGQDWLSLAGCEPVEDKD